MNVELERFWRRRLVDSSGEYPSLVWNTGASRFEATKDAPDFMQGQDYTGRDIDAILEGWLFGREVSLGALPFKMKLLSEARDMLPGLDIASYTPIVDFQAKTCRILFHSDFKKPARVRFEHVFCTAKGRVYSAVLIEPPVDE